MSTGLEALELYHVGVLVENLEEAMESLAATTGAMFLPPRVSHVDRMDERTGSGPSDVRMTFSWAGPPYLELLEVTGSGLYSAENCGVHHMGYWVEDPAAAIVDLERRGLRREAVKYGGDGEVLLAYFEPASPLRTRVEVVHRARSSALLSAWRRDVNGGGVE